MNTNDAGDLFPSVLSCRDVVELQGPPGSAKSQFLYHNLISCILPATYQSHLLGGWNRAAFLFDTDLTFDLQRFRRLMATRLNHLLQSLGVPHHHSEIITDLSLKRLHVFRPSSSSQLAATLLYLPSYMALHLPDFAMGIIAIDSLSAFHWADRFIVEQGRALPRTSPTHVSVYPLHNIASALEKIRLSFHPLVLLTNWGLDHVQASGASSSFPLFRQHLFPFPTPFASDEKTASADTPTSPLTLTAQVTFVPVHRRVMQQRDNLPIPFPSTPLSLDLEQTTQVDCLIRRPDRDPERFVLHISPGSIEVEENRLG